MNNIEFLFEIIGFSITAVLCFITFLCYTHPEAIFILVEALFSY